MKYDAFISYRHGELDGFVAEKLHKMLETYHIPAAIAKKTGRKRIKRVFRDREELPTSSNLSGSIEDALQNSEFLLLICSPRLLKSKWCMREVEIFGQIHGKDKIITLLIDGEPDEAFPPDIRFREIDGQVVEVEPLAADIRAATWKENLKLLKNEKLRLIAPLLGCAFDDLRQRHRARRIRIMTSIVGSVLAGSLGFGGFSTYQYFQIQHQMQLKLENHSYVLAEYSDEALTNGYPEIAALLALEALPKSPDRPERPHVKAAEMALANALGVYDMTNGFKPHKTVTLSAAPGGMILSPGERYAAVTYTFELVILDPQTGESVETLPTVESSLAGAEFLSDNVIVFAGEDGLTAYDIENATVLWVGEKATSVTISDDRSVVAAVFRDEDKALLYSADGQTIGQIPFGGKHCPVPPNDTFLNPRDFVFALNSDGSKLTASFADGSLSVFDTGGSLREVVLYPASGAIHFAGGFCGDFLSFSVVENEPYAAKYMVYDLQNALFTLELSSQTSKFMSFSNGDGLYFAHENQIYEVDGAAGKMAHIASVGEQIESIRKNGSTFLACDSTGGYHFIGEGVTSYVSDYVCDFTVLGNDFALVGSYDSETVRIIKKQESPAPVVFAYDVSYAFSEAKINSNMEQILLYSYRGFSLYSLNGTPLAEVAFPSPEKVIDTQYEKNSGNLAVIYDDSLLIYSSEDGSLLLEKSGARGEKSVSFTSFGVHIMEESGQVSLVDIERATVVEIGSVPPDADLAVLVGKPLYRVGGQVFFDGTVIGEGNFLGGVYHGGDGYSFAIAGNESGKVFTVRSGGLKEAFTFNVRGKAEAFFTGDLVFITELRGTATAYRIDGTVARTFSPDGYVTETEPLGDSILMHLISATSGRYSLLLDSKTLEAGAYLPGLLDILKDNTLIFDDGGGHLRSSRVYDVRELTDAANQALNGRTLTDNERSKYRAD